MIIDSNNYQLYTYFKTLDTRAKQTPEDKKPGISGLIDLLTPGPHAGTALSPEFVSAQAASRVGKSR